MRKSKGPLPVAAALASTTDAAAPVQDSEVVVGFCADNSLFSRAIAFLGLGFWSHMTSVLSSDQVIDARDDVTKIPGAPSIPAGVRVRPIHYLDVNPYYIELGIRCTGEQRVQWHTNLISQLDEPYDLPGVLDFMNDNVTDPNWRSGRSRHPWFCDEYGIWALQDPCWIIRRQMLPAYRRTPQGASEICAATEGAYIRRFKGDKVAALLEAAGFDMSKIQQIEHI